LYESLTLREKQSDFVEMVELLLAYARYLGFELTFGDTFAKNGHKDNSCHYIKLAIDINLFKDGIYLTETKDHAQLGEFWEAIGGSWGGRYGDGNHYSLKHQGRE